MNELAHNALGTAPEARLTSAELVPLLYTELRRLAAQKLAREAPGQTLQATALVHEAFLRLSPSGDKTFDNEHHFFAAAAEAMRRILVDRGRHKKSLREGGRFQRVELDNLEIASPLPDDELLAVDEALDKLAEVDGQAAQLVKLRFFAGLTHEEVARILGLNRTAADRMWLFARAWLYHQIRPDEPP